MLREDREFAGAAAQIPRSPRISRNISRHRTAAEQQRGDIKIAYHSPVRFSTDRKSRMPRKNAFQEWIRGERCTREPFVLRFGGDLQHSPARHCEQIARPQGRHIATVEPDMIAAGNIGCMVQMPVARQFRWCIRLSFSIGRQEVAAGLN